MGFVIFVPNMEKGEHVKFKITKVRRRFAVAELVLVSPKTANKLSIAFNASTHQPVSSVWRVA
jgi:tRNA/tmRNA/rRNA uracil-C5-methylase (TrmA/RlmC/RlmD family)